MSKNVRRKWLLVMVWDGDGCLKRQIPVAMRHLENACGQNTNTAPIVVFTVHNCYIYSIWCKCCIVITDLSLHMHWRTMMLMNRHSVFVVFLLVFEMKNCLAQDGGLSRGSFPQGFVFGTASSSYQVTISFLSVSILYILISWSYSASN